MVEGQTKDNICKTLSATLFLKSHPPKRTLCHLYIRYMIKCDKNFNTVILLLFLPVTTIISRKRLTKLNSIESPCNLRWPTFRNVTVTPPRDPRIFGKMTFSRNWEKCMRLIVQLTPEVRPHCSWSPWVTVSLLVGSRGEAPDSPAILRFLSLENSWFWTVLY